MVVWWICIPKKLGGTASRGGTKGARSAEAAERKLVTMAQRTVIAIEKRIIGYESGFTVCRKLRGLSGWAIACALVCQKPLTGKAREHAETDAYCPQGASESGPAHEQRNQSARRTFRYIDPRFEEPDYSDAQAVVQG